MSHSSALWRGGPAQHPAFPAGEGRAGDFPAGKQQGVRQTMVGSWMMDPIVLPCRKDGITRGMPRLQQVGIMGSSKDLFSTWLVGMAEGASLPHSQQLRVGRVPASGSSGISPASATSGIAPASGTSGNGAGSDTSGIFPASGTSGIAPVRGTWGGGGSARGPAGRSERGRPSRAQLSFGTAIGSKSSSCVGTVPGEARATGAPWRAAPRLSLASPGTWHSCASQGMGKDRSGLHSWC